MEVGAVRCTAPNLLAGMAQGPDLGVSPGGTTNFAPANRRPAIVPNTDPLGQSFRGPTALILCSTGLEQSADGVSCPWALNASAFIQMIGTSCSRQEHSALLPKVRRWEGGRV